MGFWTKSKKEVPSLSESVKGILESADKYGLTGNAKELKLYVKDEQDWILAVAYMVRSYQDGYIKGLEENNVIPL